MQEADDIKEFRVFYTFMLTASIVLSIAYISRLGPLLLSVLLVTPIISFVLLVAAFLSVRVSQTSDEIIVEKEQDCAVKIRIKNKFILPITPIVIKGIFFNETDNTISQRTIIAEVKPFSEVSVDIPFITMYRGEYSVGIDSYEVYDILRLLKLKKKLSKRTTIIVLPRNIDINGLKEVGETEADNYRGTINNINKNDFSSFREYRIGDKMQHIHWKLTSKHDDFIVKQMEQTISRSAVIFCDFTAPEDKTETDYHIMSDAVIESALAIVKRCVNDGNSATLCRRDPETSADEIIEISDGNQYRELYFEFALQSYKPASGQFCDLLRVFSAETDLAKTIYMIMNNIDLEFIKFIEEKGFSLRKNVIILLFTVTEHDKAHLDYIAAETRVTLKLVNPADIASALSEI